MLPSRSWMLCALSFAHRKIILNQSALGFWATMLFCVTSWQRCPTSSAPKSTTRAATDIATASIPYSNPPKNLVPDFIRKTRVSFLSSRRSSNAAQTIILATYALSLPSRSASPQFLAWMLPFLLYRFLKVPASPLLEPSSHTPQANSPCSLQHQRRQHWRHDGQQEQHGWFYEPCNYIMQSLDSTAALISSGRSIARCKYAWTVLISTRNSQELSITPPASEVVAHHAPVT